VQRFDGVSARDFLRGTLRPVLAAIPMFAAVSALRLSLTHLGIDRTWTSLILEVLVGAAVFILAAFLVARPTVDDSLVLMRRTMNRRAA
jgi:hypothetical protein